MPSPAPTNPRETQSCAVYPLEPDVMCWSRTRLQLGWESLKKGDVRRDTYSSSGDFGVTPSRGTTRITHHERLEAWGEEVAAVPSETQPGQISLGCKGRRS